jgi:type VI secretion system protein ImpB
MAESTQHKLDRVRPPRVQITYDVEIGGAIVMKELPFVVGIMSDLSGKPEEPLPKLKQRKFVEIDRDNFNDVLASSKPRLTFQVDNKLVDDGSKLNIELKFSHMDDFNPVNVLKQVEPLNKLFEARGRLSDLIGKLDGNDDLDKLLQDIVENTEGLKEIKAQTAGGEEAPKEGKAKAKKEAETPEESPEAG